MLLLPSSLIAGMFSAAERTLKHYPGYPPGLISKADWRPIMDTHIALVACKDYETVREVPDSSKGDSKFNNVFTQALISAFKSADLNDKPTTYYDLVKVLPQNETQHPVIAGKYMKS